MIWLPEERDKEHPSDAVLMAYTARHPRCGHVRILSVDKRNSSLDDLVGSGFAGLLLSREPAEAAKADFQECEICRDPTQRRDGLVRLSR